MRLLSRGKLPLRVGTDPISKNRPRTTPTANSWRRRSPDPGHVFINHTKEFEFFTGVNDKLVKYAADAGYRREIMAHDPPTATDARSTRYTVSRRSDSKTNRSTLFSGAP